MLSRISRTCLIFSTVRLKASINCQLELMQSRSGRTCLIFLHYAFLKCLLKLSACIDTKLHWLDLFDFFNCAFLKCLLKLSDWNDTKLHWLHLFDFLIVLFLNASSNCQFEMMQIRTDRTCLIFLNCAFLKCLLILSAWINAKSHWLHLFDFS